MPHLAVARHLRAADRDDLRALRPPSLAVAKFIPGFAAVATALAGAVRTRFSTFFIFDAIGAALWAGVAIGVGWLFRDAVETLLATLTRLGEIGIGLVVAALLVFVALKWWERRRFLLELRMARVTVDELARMLDAGTAPMILDVRTAEARASDGWIPGAIAYDEKTIAVHLPDAHAEREVIVYCSCPNEASAARVAKMLKARGFTRVRPLTGGIEDWARAGHRIERGEVIGRARDDRIVPAS